MTIQNPTMKRFQTQPYLKETTVKILAVEDDAVILDSSIFAPEAGGQSCDLGTIESSGSSQAPVEIRHVEEKEGVLYHRLKTVPADFQPGKEVILSLNWDRRFDHMQNHCAEHILSGILFTKHGIGNKGFHLGTDFSTLDADIKQASKEFIEELETLANDVVFSKLPVEVEMIENKEEAEKLPLRKALKVEEDISIVTIPGVDCVACCCPHPATTAEVGLIKIIKAENYKGMTRIYFKSGRRALADYRQKHDVISALNQKYSSDEFSLLDNIKIQEAKINQIKRELHTMKEIFSDQEAEKLISRSPNHLILGQYRQETLDGLKLIAKKVMEKTDLPVVLSSESGLCVLLTHTGNNKIKCGQIVKEFACGYGGKGGGSDTLAQAIFTDKEVMDNFLKIVEAHVK